MSDPVQELRTRLTRQCAYHTSASGRTAGRFEPVFDYFDALERKDRRVESAMVGDRAMGWMWPCGSVYLESKWSSDPDIKALERRFDDIEVVASLAGAPHTLDHDAALALYRDKGWLADARLTLDLEHEDLTDVVVLFRPTLVLHDRRSPMNPIAVGTAELRVELAGPKALITSARMLGFAILHSKPKAAAWFLAHVLSMDLGDASSELGYTVNDGQCLIMLDTPQPEVDGSKLGPIVRRTLLDHFREHFSARAISDNELDNARFCAGIDDDDDDDFGFGDEDVAYDDDLSQRDRALSRMSIAYVSDEHECADLLHRLESQARDAVCRFAASEKRPGFARIIGLGDREAVRVDALGIPDRLQRATEGLALTIGVEVKDVEFRSMSVQAIEIRGIATKPMQAVALHYAPGRDRHPFTTWDNSEFGVLDTLELLFPGASHGEGHSTRTLQQLGYPGRPSLCVVLQAPDARVTKATAESVAAAMLLAAARMAKAKRKYREELVCVELPEMPPYPDDEPEDKTRNQSYRALAEAFARFGFVATSAWVHACPATVWQRICAWEQPEAANAATAGA